MRDAAWSGMSRQDYIIVKLTDTQVEVKPSMSVQKTLRDPMAKLAKEVHLAASYGELSEPLQQRIELVMRFFLALGKSVDTSAAGTSQEEKLPVTSPATNFDADADNASIFGMERG